MIFHLLRALEQPEDHVSETGDCDDNDLTRYPGKLEFCNGEDDDCDTIIDEEDAYDCTTYYKDEDKDGYGVDKDTRCLCEPEDIYTATQGGDPNDLNPLVIPTVTIRIDMDLGSGWSMISLPVDRNSLVLSELFPKASVVYGYEKDIGYYRIKGSEELEFGKGYWILLEEEQRYPLTGQLIDYHILTVENGWYMIGRCTGPAKVSLNNGTIKAIYGYTPHIGYEKVLETENLLSGKGYWILFDDIINQSELMISLDDY